MTVGHRKILVTGATGFIGSRIVRKLVDAGHAVKILRRPGSSMRSLADVPADAYEVAEGDITVGHTVYRALAGCDRMFHTAAMVKMWDRDPRSVLDPSIVGTHETLEAARRRDIEKIVVTSSIAAHGTTAEPEAFDESKENNLTDPEQYVHAKLEADLIVRQYIEDGLPVVVVCPGGVFGPGDWRPTMSGAGLLEYLNWALPIRFPCNEGGFSISDVEDCAAGHVLAMQKGEIGERYFLGGENVTFREFFTILSELTGLPGPGRDAPRSAAMWMGRLMETGARIFGGEPRLTYRMARDYVGFYQWPSSARAETELGYASRSAPEALGRAVRWYCDNGFVRPSNARRIRLHRPA